MSHHRVMRASAQWRGNIVLQPYVQERERTGRAMCTVGGKNRRAAGRASRDIDLFPWKPHLECGSKRSTSNNPGFLREKRLVHSSEAWDDEFEEIKAEAVAKLQRKMTCWEWKNQRSCR